jgi:hypothetical protein
MGNMTLRHLKWIAKTGYVARALVYFIIGGFAVAAALGSADATGTKGAMLRLLETGYGTTLLTLLAVGLLCFALWRLFQGVMDADEHGTDIKGLIVRSGLLVSALVHASLAFVSLSIAFGMGRGEGGGKSGVAAWLMQQPFGPWLVMAVGACIVGAGVAHAFKGATRGYEKWFQADERQMKLIRAVSSIGLIARGIVFLIVGAFFIYAGFTVDPQEAGGLEEALQWLRGLPFGLLLFSVVAAGLVCFGAYSFLEAVYRRVRLVEHIPATKLSGSA